MQSIKREVKQWMCIISIFVLLLGLDITWHKLASKPSWNYAWPSFWSLTKLEKKTILELGCYHQGITKSQSLLCFLFIMLKFNVKNTRFKVELFINVHSFDKNFQLDGYYTSSLFINLYCLQLVILYYCSVISTKW